MTETQINLDNTKLLKLGLKNDKIVSIDEVENGLRCGCVCPSCHQPLIAKNNPNNKKVAHFAHYKSLECSAAIETALHKLAKEILFEEKSLFIPDYRMSAQGKTKSYIKKRLIEFEFVEIEKKVTTGETYIIADSIGVLKGRVLIVEFAKTHFVDENKEAKIKKSNYACVEIDISDLEQSRDAVREVLLKGMDRIMWISNPEGDRLFKLDQEAYERRKEEEKIAQQKQREKDQQELERKLKEYKAKGYYFIKAKADGSFFCPGKKLIKEGFSQTSFGQHEVIQMILKGEKWNGKMYGFYPDPKHIYVGTKMIEILPHYDLDINEKEEKQKKFLYASLKKLQALRKLLSKKPCKHCAFLKDEINSITICSFKKGKESTEVDFYDYKDLWDDEEERRRFFWLHDL